ncbi:glycoside hydrolase family 3 C-terminal domain-containing protein [Paenibacillus beijingensis]|uniref:Glycosyl hydrolase family 3 n=1 Tax=Paenibacillus beijingensis TaxID=1126833 RepID=A0A0D5NMN5_9BACL|nr:glycoside hydrolase family 3 C-terminal domain-containing protein [Paenibacillus beijingensis]AJY76163.1 glycosyl hydrolase family 3 [Paenibacillus beijingensis]
MSSQTEQWLEQLTLDEKIRLCAGENMWSTAQIERLGIPPLFMADGPHGVRKEKSDILLGVSEPATCFPTASALASTWNVELIEQIGTGLGTECRRLDVQLLLGPGINMKRSPLCGRNFEYYSEDPYLSGEIGAAFIQGVQSQGVGTTLKHFACYNTEFERMTISSEVDERVMREIYLAAFERIIKKAEPWSMMASYNKVNGTYATESKFLLTDVLRGEWGYTGFVMSDWLAVQNRVKALEAGMDLEMPGPALSGARALKEAVLSGALPEQSLNDAARNILRAVEKSMEPANTNPDWSFETAHGLARAAAEEGIVLLRNEGGILPLDRTQLSSLAVIGRNAKFPLVQGGGSAKINPAKLDIPFDEIRNLVDARTDIFYADGYMDKAAADLNLIAEAVKAAGMADAVLLFVGDGEDEGNDREHMDLPESHVQLLQAVAAVNRNCIVILNNGSAVEMRRWIDSVPAILEAWLHGQAGGSAIANIVFGEANPSGKLPETFPVKLSDNPSYLNFPGDQGRTVYGEGLFIGYRYYDRKQIEPQFPFGHGLSYTTFEYSDLQIERKREEGELSVSVNITNSGHRAGKEIVQLYIGDPQCGLVRPDKELKGFAKVDLAPGETKTVTIDLDKRDFSYYDPKIGDWAADSGSFDLFIGASSQDIRLSERIELEFASKPVPPLNEYSLLKEWLSTDQGAQAVRYLAEHVAEDSHLKEMILNGELRGFFQEMPLYRFVRLLSKDGTAARWSDRMMEDLFGQ